MWCRIWNTRFDPALRRRSPRRVSTEKGRSYGWCRLIAPFFVFCCMHDNAGRASCSTGAKFSKSLFAVFLIVVSPSGILGYCYRQLVAGVYGGPVTGRHLLLRSGASCSHLLLAVMALIPISAWVVDRLLSQSLNMRIPFHAAGSSWGLLPCRLLVWPLLILVLPFYRFSVNSKPVLFFDFFPLYRCAWQS